ncbi:FAD:protein FMN transferase [Nocardioides sp. GXZ039]|uniref:FAD:protein FMN transferase n=1 Tax=Nocardioides sp. GXZ039 TaxID=3136018 RepID=UPI0030F46C61
MPTTMSPGTRTWKRWTTTCRLVVTDVTRTARAYDLANRLMGRIESAIDCYSPTSEISRLTAGTHEVSALLASVLDAALDVERATDGLVTPVLGAWPRSRSRIRLDGSMLTLGAGIRLDLGATGKARAADLIADRIHRECGTGVLVSLGGDIATAGGPIGGWQVAVQDAEDDPALTVSLAAGAAIATSSTLHRQWRDERGHLGHHLRDPRTGTSARTPWRTATVVAPTCLEANGAATAALIRGVEGPEWLRRAGLPARLVGIDGRIDTFHGFPSEMKAVS